MARYKNISGGALDVPLLGRLVEDGETVDFPDTQADGTSPIVVPENRWKPVADSKASSAKTDNAPAKADDGKADA
jgi:hypothetical protein